GRCLPYGEALGYWALATALKEAAGITAEASAGAARDKLNELVKRITHAEPHQDESDLSGEEIARHLALLSGLDTVADRPSKPEDQRVLHASARRVFEALAKQKPLCLLFEDIHWADDALLDF